MSTDKDSKGKTDLQRRLLIGGSLAFAGTAASGVLTGCGGGASSKVAASDGTMVTEMPAFAPVAGTYSTAQSVTISSATSGATIYCTTDGTTPTTSSTVYSSPIPVSATKTVRAMAAASGYQPSTVASAA